MRPCDACGRPTKSKWCDQCRTRMQASKAKPSPAARGYCNSAWRTFRLKILAAEPLCRGCLTGSVAAATAPNGTVQLEKSGRITEAYVVDHILPIDPHQGERDFLFFLEGNHAPLCSRCHDLKRKSEDNGRAAALRASIRTVEEAQRWLQRLRENQPTPQ